MSEQKLVSVIIPNYNHASYLDERIQSVLAQTYKNIEVIILDDCSTDNSLEVIKKYEIDSRLVKVVVNKQNSGSTFEQWEKGFELSSGEFIWIAESDDSCSPYLLETLVKPMILYSDCVLSYSRSLRLNIDGLFYNIYESQQDMNNELYLKGADFINVYLKNQNYIVNASSAIFKKESLLSIKHDYRSWKGCGDWLFWIYLAETGNVAYTPYALNYFRYHLLNTTSKKDKDGTNDTEMKKIIDYLNSCGYYSCNEYLAKRVGRYLWHKSLMPFESHELEKKFIEEWNLSKLSILSYKANQLFNKLF